MNWLFPSIVATLSATIASACIYSVLGIREKSEFLGKCATGWWFYSLRFVFSLVMLKTPHSNLLILAEQIFTLISGMYIHWGSYIFRGRSNFRNWYPVYAFIVVWIILSTYLELTYLFITMPSFLLLGIVYFDTGIMFLRGKGYKNVFSGITGITFILWGLHKLNYPFLRNVSWFAPFGFLLAALFELTVAFCIILTYYQKNKEELIIALDKLESQKVLLAETEKISHTGSWLLDIATGRLSWSDEVYCIFGIREQSIQPDYGLFLDMVHPEDRSKVDEAYRTSLSGKKDFYEIEHRIIKNNGETRYLYEKCVHEKNAAGDPVRSLGMVQDITDFRKSEEEKELLDRKLLQIQKMESIGRLAGGIAHDFNNYLSVIIGNLDMMLGEITPEDRHYEELKEVYSAACKSSALTRQLLAFSRKQPVEPMNVDINLEIQEMLKMLKRIIGENVELIWEPAPGNAVVKIDPNQLCQVIANICVNARDAIVSYGKIEIETDTRDFDGSELLDGLFPEGRFVRLKIADNGCGMDKETLSRVFEPFFTTKEEGRGTGLGLSTVYGIVRQNNGFVTVKSEKGKGTEFEILLPLCDEAAENADNTKPEPEAVADSRKLILIVDDDPGVINMTSRFLEKTGYSVIKASSADEALAFVSPENRRIDLLVTDVIMPDMGGYELAEKLKQKQPGLRVLFMSGYTADIIVQHGIKEDEINFICKPYSLHELLQKIKSIL